MQWEEDDFIDNSFGSHDFDYMFTNVWHVPIENLLYCTDMFLIF